MILKKPILLKKNHIFDFLNKYTYWLIFKSILMTINKLNLYLNN